MKKEIKTREAPSPAGPYSQALVLEGNQAARQIYLAGTLPLDPPTNQIVGETIEEQTGFAFHGFTEISQYFQILEGLVRLSDHGMEPGLAPQGLPALAKGSRHGENAVDPVQGGFIVLLKSA